MLSAVRKRDTGRGRWGVVPILWPRKVRSVTSHDGKVIPCYHSSNKAEQDGRGAKVGEPQKQRPCLKGTGPTRSPAAPKVPHAGTSVSDGWITHHSSLGGPDTHVIRV